MSVRHSAALILLGVLRASPVHAQWIVSVYGGAAHTCGTSLTIDRPLEQTSLQFEGLRFRDKSFRSPIYYGYRLSRVLASNPRLFIGGEFIHAKIYADGSRSVGHGAQYGHALAAVPFSTVVQQFAMSHGLNFILVNAAVRYPVSRRVSVHAAAGAGPMLPHAEVEIDGATREGYQVAGVGLQAAAGVETRIWRRLSLLTEYKWTHARLSIELDDGTIDVSPISHHFAVGLTSSFGPAR